MTKTVYVIDGDSQICEMFRTEPGYQLVPDLVAADIVVFPGGADVNPELYGEKAIPETGYDLRTDERHMKAYSLIGKDQLKVGICRGGQFLNVVSGGKMWQDVTGHGRMHRMTDFATGEIIEVVSTHHQMMRPGPNGELLAAARFQSRHYKNAEYPKGVPIGQYPEWEAEVIWYKDKNSLCFQPHPEYYSKDHPYGSTRKYFFELLSKVS